MEASKKNQKSKIKNDYFTLKKSNTDLSENSKNYINYISFMAIENTYDNVLPNQFDKLKKIININLILP